MQRKISSFFSTNVQSSSNQVTVETEISDAEEVYEDFQEEIQEDLQIENDNLELDLRLSLSDEEDAKSGTKVNLHIFKSSE